MKQIRNACIAFSLCLAAYSCVEPGNVPISHATKESYLQACVDDSRAISALCEGFSYTLEQSIFYNPNRYGKAVTVRESYTGGFYTIYFTFDGMCNDGVVRSGSITAKMDSVPWKTDNKIELKYTNYSTNGATFTGMQYLTITQASYTDTLPLSATFIACTSSVKNASMVETVNNDKHQSMWSGEQEWEWNPKHIFIAGNGKGTTKFGFNYSYLIIDDLLKPLGCKYISEGVEEMVTERDTAIFDFDTFGGEDECDRFVYLTFQGNTTEEKLPY